MVHEGSAGNIRCLVSTAVGLLSCLHGYGFFRNSYNFKESMLYFVVYWNVRE